MKRGLWYVFADIVSLAGWDYILAGKSWWEVLLDILDSILKSY